MDIAKFLEEMPNWASNPCLYIVKQDVKDNVAYRCGMAGRKLFAGSDLAYGSEYSKTGLNSRINMYIGFWKNSTPFTGTIYAALTIRKQLVAGENANKTLVQIREKEFHAILDEKNYRLFPNKELFVPGRKGVKELINALRQVKGEQLYLFDSKKWTIDSEYDSSATPLPQPAVLKTQPKRQVATEGKAKTITIKLSKKAIEELKEGSPKQFKEILALIRKVDPPKPNIEPIITRGRAKE